MKDETLLLLTLLTVALYWYTVESASTRWRERDRTEPVPATQAASASPEVECHDSLTYFAVWTTKAGLGTGVELDWRQEAAFASVFARDRCAKVRLYSNAISTDVASRLEQRFASCKQDFAVVRYDLPALLNNTAAAAFAPRVAARRDLGPNWYSNESNLLRFLLLYLYGGVYMDTDVIFVRSAGDLPWSSLGWESSTWVNGAILKFPAGSPYLADCLAEFASNYRGNVWGFNGPKLLTRMLKASKAKDEVTVLPVNAFYMFHYQTASARCFEATEGEQYEKDRSVVTTEAIAVHLSNKVTHEWGTEAKPLRHGSICYDLFHSYAPRCGGEQHDHVDAAAPPPT